MVGLTYMFTHLAVYTAHAAYAKVEARATEYKVFIGTNIQPPSQSYSTTSLYFVINFTLGITLRYIVLQFPVNIEC